MKTSWATRWRWTTTTASAASTAYQKLLDSGVDVAILAEPPHFRPMHIEACVDAGVHVFAEKPMAVDAPGVRRVLAAGEKAQRKNLSFVSGFETRYSPARARAVRRIHDGAIGDIVAIQTTYNTGPCGIAAASRNGRRWSSRCATGTTSPGSRATTSSSSTCTTTTWWAGSWGTAAGARLGLRRARCRTEPKYGDIFDHHAVVYEYANGVRYFAFTRQQRNCFNENSKIIFGTKGKMVSQRGWSMQDLPATRSGNRQRTRRHPELNCFEEMFAAMRAGTPINDSLSMARSTMHAILGRMATHGGQRVTWDQGIESQVTLAPDAYTMDAQTARGARRRRQLPRADPRCGRQDRVSR